MKRLKNLFILSLVATLVFFIAPQPTKADYLLSPFGGPIKKPAQDAAGCDVILAPINTAITLALAAATFGIGALVAPTFFVEEMEVGPPKEAKLGLFGVELGGVLGVGAVLDIVRPILNILGINIPDVSKLYIMPTELPGLPNRIYRHYQYKTPSIWVVGNSINICDVCGKLGSAPVLGAALKGVCGLEIADVNVTEEICDAIGTATNCPITNLIFNMGTGKMPDPKALK